MRNFIYAGMIGLLLLSAACGHKAESDFSVETKDGIEFAHNSKTPLNQDATVVFEEDLSIEPVDKNGNIRIYHPSHFAVNENDYIFICDSRDPSVKVFDLQGQLVRTIGRKGSGPGEFETVGRVYCLPDGRIMVLDIGLRRGSLFSNDGRFISIHKFLNAGYNMFFFTESFYVREERIIERDTTPLGWKRVLFVKAFDYTGEELFSYGKFTASQSALVDEGGRRFSYTKPYDVKSVLAGDQKNKWLYHCLNDQYLIEVFDHEGSLIRKIDRPCERLPVTELGKRQYLESFHGSSEKDLALIEKNVEMPKLKPVCSRMLVDDDGRLWVELNEKKEKNGQTLSAYDIFDEDGRYLCKIWSEISPGLFKNGRMYSMERDEETGDRILKRYRIVILSSQPFTNDSLVTIECVFRITLQIVSILTLPLGSSLSPDLSNMTVL